MENRNAWLPATMSFLLPGLGHVYLEKSMRGVAFFGAFTLCNWSPMTRAFVPVIAIVSSYDAFHGTPREFAPGVVPRPKRAAFLAVGLVGFLGWMAMYAAVLVPFRSQLSLNASAEKLSHSVIECARRLGRLPAGLDECGAGLEGWKQARDPWGAEYRYLPQSQGSFEIRSAGRDGKLGTEDDFVAHFTFRR